jgi:hypothetical protein
MSMKGVRVLLDEATNKRIIQIDMDLVEKDRERVEDYLDVLLFESRKHEPSVALEDFERRMKKAPKK